MNILFVCTGNTCRSPMAASIFNDVWSDKGQAKSVGVFAAEGHGANPHTVSTLQENGISIGHQAKQLANEDLEWASLILTMTASHKAVIIEQYPQVAKKLFTLKEYVYPHLDDKDIMDPFGGSKEVYQSTYEELKELIEKMF